MNTSTALATSRMQVLSGAALSVLWVLFAVAHLTVFWSSGRACLLVFAIAETVVAMFLLLRAPPKTLTRNPVEWLVAIVGTFLPLLLRPAEGTAGLVYEWGLIVGSLLQIAGVLSLNRSLALVPALRELKTSGMYRIVRHPIYFSYLITFSSYLAANFSLPNCGILLLSLCLLVARLHYEERHLSQSPEYCAYRTRVRWRLVPFVF